MPTWIRTLILLLLAGYIGWLMGVYQSTPLVLDKSPLSPQSDILSGPPHGYTCPEPEPLVVNICQEQKEKPQGSENFTPNQTVTSVGNPLANFILADDVAMDESEYWHLQISQGPNHEAKLAAIDELALRRESDKLAAGLADPSLEIRRATVRGLGRIGDNNAVRILATVLFSDPSADNRLETIEVMSTLRYDPNTDLFLQTAMQQDAEHSVRKAAARVLGETDFQHK